MTRANLTGYRLFILGELDYAANDAQAAMEHYRQGIEKIISQEDITQPVPPVFLARMDPGCTPSTDLIWLVWQNMAAFLRDPHVDVSSANSPKAYEFVAAFKGGSKAHRAPFAKHGARGLYIYKAMQVSALTTLGLLAWDGGDRATAAKRYTQAIALAETEPAFVDPASPAADSIAKAVYLDYADTCKFNLAIVILNDHIHSAELGGQLVGRKESRVLPRLHTRLEADGSVTAQTEVTFASDVCRGCGKRDVGMKTCSKCQEALYCGKECQKEHWTEHKRICRRPMR